MLYITAHIQKVRQKCHLCKAVISAAVCQVQLCAKVCLTCLQEWIIE